MGKTYKPTSSMTFTVSHVGEVQLSRRGDPFVECESTTGIVAFWGGKGDRSNIDRVCAARPTFRITCHAFEPDSGKHALWVPQTARIDAIEERGPDVDSPSVSAQDLAAWRRAIIQILNRIEGLEKSSPERGVAGQIASLSRQGKVPREVAAFMRTVTEMRNTTEYEGKVLSPSESAAVSAAWSVVCEWAVGQGIDPPMGS
jgi:hypothetical protein